LAGYYYFVCHSESGEEYQGRARKTNVPHPATRSIRPDFIGTQDDKECHWIIGSSRIRCGTGLEGERSLLSLMNGIPIRWALDCRAPTSRGSQRQAWWVQAIPVTTPPRDPFASLRMTRVGGLSL